MFIEGGGVTRGDNAEESRIHHTTEGREVLTEEQRIALAQTRYMEKATQDWAGVPRHADQVFQWNNYMAEKVRVFSNEQQTMLAQILGINLDQLSSLSWYEHIEGINKKIIALKRDSARKPPDPNNQAEILYIWMKGQEAKSGNTAQYTEMMRWLVTQCLGESSASTLFDKLVNEQRKDPDTSVRSEVANERLTLEQRLQVMRDDRMIECAEFDSHMTKAEQERIKRVLYKFDKKYLQTFDKIQLKAKEEASFTNAPKERGVDSRGRIGGKLSINRKLLAVHETSDDVLESVIAHELCHGVMDYIRVIDSKQYDALMQRMQSYIKNHLDVLETNLYVKKYVDAAKGDLTAKADLDQIGSHAELSTRHLLDLAVIEFFTERMAFQVNPNGSDAHEKIWRNSHISLNDEGEAAVNEIIKSVFKTFDECLQVEDNRRGRKKITRDIVQNNKVLNESIKVCTGYEPLAGHGLNVSQDSVSVLKESSGGTIALLTDGVSGCAMIDNKIDPELVKLSRKLQEEAKQMYVIARKEGKTHDEALGIHNKYLADNGRVNGREFSQTLIAVKRTYDAHEDKLEYSCLGDGYLFIISPKGEITVINGKDQSNGSVVSDKDVISPSNTECPVHTVGVPKDSLVFAATDGLDNLKLSFGFKHSAENLVRGFYKDLGRVDMTFNSKPATERARILRETILQHLSRMQQDRHADDVSLVVL